MENVIKKVTLLSVTVTRDSRTMVSTNVGVALILLCTTRTSVKTVVNGF